MNMKENKYQLIFENSPVAYASVNQVGNIVEVNDLAVVLLERSRWELEKNPFVSLLDIEKHKLFFAFLRDIYEKRQLKVIDIEIMTGKKKRIHVRIHGRNIEDVEGEIGECILSIINIDDIKRQEEEVNYLVYHDPLTGLYNRRRLEERLEELIIESKRNAERFAIFYMDLDGFKGINDTMGHTYGDQVLIETAKRIQNSVRKTELVARMGGDEFCIIMSRLADEKDATILAQRLINAIKEPYVIMEKKSNITTSLGIAIYPIDGNNAYDLLINADAAMYESKNRYKGAYSFSNEKVRNRLEKSYRNVSALSQAVERNELYYVIQPIVNVARKPQISEVLMRWHSKKLGEMSPSYFIDLAEKNHLISYIEDWLIEDLAMKEELAKTLRDRNMKLTLNISRFQLLEEGFVLHLIQMIENSIFEPSQLVIEITEDALIEDLMNGYGVITELNKYGIHIALDDFGTAYSSMLYLNEPSIEYLKIDEAFTSHCDEDKSKQKVIMLIIEAARFLDIKVIAEGVENENEFEFLKEHGCELYQGYYFSKPLPLIEFETYIQE